jgi:putative secretion ATPase (PEP-CTERM system associated)
MYESHYGFSGSPFKLTPDARFFYSSKSHKRAIAHLTFGLTQAEGFIVITGEVGAGKTTLIERLGSQLDRNTHALVRINSTRLSGEDLLRLVVTGFGTAPGGADKAAMLLGFEAMLRATAQAGRRCLLVVDEAQNLPVAALEELRMLSNLTGEGRAPLQTILLGQPQFRRILASPDLDQLRQRVLASYHLAALAEDETRAYVEHRLGTVGWAGVPAIEAAAFSALHLHSGGIPRRINRLCGRVLLHAALQRADRLTAAMVEAMAAELQEDLGGTFAPLTPAASNGLGKADAGALGPTSEPSPYHAAAPGREEMLERIELLELQVAQRERTLQRLRTALAGHL